LQRYEVQDFVGTHQTVLDVENNFTKAFQVDYSIHLTQEKIKNGYIFVEAISSSQDISTLTDEQIEKNSSDFISARKQMLIKLFEHSSLFKIVGESGVGKSSLLTSQTPISTADFVEFNL